MESTRSKVAAAAASVVPFHCVICFDEFNLTDRTPMVLPCGHTYVCCQCTKRLKRCMECREPLFVSVPKAALGVGAGGHSSGANSMHLNNHHAMRTAGSSGSRGSPPPPPPHSYHHHYHHGPSVTTLHLPPSQMGSGGGVGGVAGSSNYQYGLNRGHQSEPVMNARANNLQIPLPIPKNVVLVAVMEAAQRQERLEQASSSSQRFSGPNQGGPAPGECDHSIVDDEDDDEEEFDLDKIISGMATLAGPCGTYSVTDVDGLDVVAEHPAKFEQEFLRQKKLEDEQEQREIMEQQLKEEVEQQKELQITSSEASRQRRERVTIEEEKKVEVEREQSENDSANTSTREDDDDDDPACDDEDDEKDRCCTAAELTSITRTRDEDDAEEEEDGREECPDEPERPDEEERPHNIREGGSGGCEETKFDDGEGEEIEVHHEDDDDASTENNVSNATTTSSAAHESDKALEQQQQQNQQIEQKTEHDSEIPRQKPLFKLRKGQTVQVVYFQNRVAKLARGQGYILVANSSQLVKVGGPKETCCRLEGLLDTIASRGRDLQSTLDENRQVEDSLRKQIEAELEKEPCHPVIVELPDQATLSSDSKDSDVSQPLTPKDDERHKENAEGLLTPQNGLATDNSLDFPAQDGPPGTTLSDNRSGQTGGGSNGSPSCPMSPNSIDNADMIPGYRRAVSEDDLDSLAFGCGAAFMSPATNLWGGQVRTSPGMLPSGEDQHQDHHDRQSSADNDNPSTRLRPRSMADTLMMHAAPTLTSSFDAVDFRTGLSGHRGLTNAAKQGHSPTPANRPVRLLMSQHTGIARYRAVPHPKRSSPTTSASERHTVSTSNGNVPSSSASVGPSFGPRFSPFPSES